MNYWADQARIVAKKAYNDGLNMGLEGKDLEKHVRAAYPFGEREMSPYKAWNAAVRKLFPKPKQHTPIDLTNHPFLRASECDR